MLQLQRTSDDGLVYYYAPSAAACHLSVLFIYCFHSVSPSSFYTNGNNNMIYLMGRVNRPGVT